MRTTVKSFSELVRALVVGVSATGEPGLPVLLSAEKDAARLSVALSDKDGCGIAPAKISVLAGPNKQAFLSKLEEVCAQTQANDGLFLYFAGHALVSNG